MANNTNTGTGNTGYWNTGYWNTGYWNTGHYNTGQCNTGDWNTGRYNTGNYCTGFFNTEDCKAGAFNGAPFASIADRSAFAAVIPAWVYAPSPTTWVPESDMSDQEKADNPTFRTCGGYLRTNDMVEEWRKAMAGATDEDIQKVRDLPSFSNAVFKEITGLDLDAHFEAPKPPRELIVDGYRYVLEGAA